MGKKNGLPPNVTEYQDKHGTWYVRFRRRGAPTYYFKAKPGTLEFREEYERAEAASKKGLARVPPGSLSALIALYYTTAAFTGLSESSRKTYRNVLEHLRKTHGLKPVALIERQHVKAIIGGMHATPQAANKLLSKLRILMALAVDEGWRKDDPTSNVKGFSRKTAGFHTWTEDDIAKFEARHPIGSKARLAFALMLYTAQRRSDMVTMGWQHIDAAGRIRIRQQKTGAVLSLPILPELQRNLDAVPRTQMTFLLTDYGRPFTANGFGNKMRTWCDEAKLPECTSHGLRKAQARRLAEAGRTNAQIKAVTGHTTDSEVNRYTAAANQSNLADQALGPVPPRLSRN
jgi:integrase